MDNTEQLQEIEITAKPLPADKHVDSRDFRIESISLIDCTGKSRDITAMIVEMEMRQDIYLGFMSAELLINDGIGLYSEVKFHGNEFVYIHIKEPGQDLPLKKAYRVYKVSKRERMQNNASRYIIYLVSNEFIESSSQRISKAYQNMMVSDMAKDIMVNFLKIPAKRVFVDATTDPQSYVIPYSRPFEALSWLTTRAYTNENNCYFFFENLEGYHFRSINSLYRDEPAIPEAFKDTHKGVEKTLALDKFAIDAWDGVKEFDVLSGMEGGMYSMSLEEIDPIARTYGDRTYNLSDNKGLYKNPPSSIDPTTMGKDAIARRLTYLSLGGSTREWIRRVMAMAALNSSLTQIVVPGSIRIQAGKTIKLEFPYLTTPSKSADNVDKLRSGLYLIVAVNHKIDMTTLRYETVALLARDSQAEAYPSADTQMPEKIRKLNQ
jgi:hypothetical protein